MQEAAIRLSNCNIRDGILQRGAVPEPPRRDAAARARRSSARGRSCDSMASPTEGRCGMERRGRRAVHADEQGQASHLSEQDIVCDEATADADLWDPLGRAGLKAGDYSDCAAGSQSICGQFASSPSLWADGSTRAPVTAESKQAARLLTAEDDPLGCVALLFHDEAVVSAQRALLLPPPPPPSCARSWIDGNLGCAVDAAPFEASCHDPLDSAALGTSFDSACAAAARGISSSMAPCIVRGHCSPRLPTCAGDSLRGPGCYFDPLSGHEHAPQHGDPHHAAPHAPPSAPTHALAPARPVTRSTSTASPSPGPPPGDARTQGASDAAGDPLAAAALPVNSAGYVLPTPPQSRRRQCIFLLPPLRSESQPCFPTAHPSVASPKHIDGLPAASPHAGDDSLSAGRPESPFESPQAASDAANESPSEAPRASARVSRHAQPRNGPHRAPLPAAPSLPQADSGPDPRGLAGRWAGAQLSSSGPRLRMSGGRRKAGLGFASPQPRRSGALRRISGPAAQLRRAAAGRHGRSSGRGLRRDSGA